jgi:C4-dicarboxylate transporter DctM subunit
MFFARHLGFGAATTAAIGGVMIPYMLEKGYDKGFSASLVACSGGIGVLIPPSIGRHFQRPFGNLGGDECSPRASAPVFVVGSFLMLISYLMAKRQGWKGDKKATLKEILAAGRDAIWALFMPILILGGIYGGIFTPTEAAAVSVIYSFVIGLWVYKEITFDHLKDVIIERRRSHRNGHDTDRRGVGIFQGS